MLECEVDWTENVKWTELHPEGWMMCSGGDVKAKNLLITYITVRSEDDCLLGCCSM
jgi:hypothetical protein